MPELRKDVLKDEEAYKHDIPDELLDRIYGEYEIQTDNTLYSSQVSTACSIPAVIPTRPDLNRRNATLNIHSQRSPLAQVIHPVPDGQLRRFNHAGRNPRSYRHAYPTSERPNPSGAKSKREFSGAISNFMPATSNLYRVRIKGTKPNFDLNHTPQPRLNPPGQRRLRPRSPHLLF
jgi:hypothetical protein